jgi:hypothetical protein
MNTPSYKYPDAIIYGIKCNETGEVYIGSTVGTLTDRMDRHRASVKRYNKWVISGSVGKRPNGCRCCSIQILNRGNYTVFEIEPYPCNTKTELCLREGNIQIQHKKELGTLCINERVAGAHARAGGELNYWKQYNEDNLEKKHEQNKQYRIDNADTIRKKSKQYQQKNADTIREKKNVKHNCSVCGGRYTHGNKSIHFRTKVHQRAMCINDQASAHHDS